MRNDWFYIDEESCDEWIYGQDGATKSWTLERGESLPDNVERVVERFRRGKAKLVVEKYGKHFVVKKLSGERVVVIPIHDGKKRSKEWQRFVSESLNPPSVQNTKKEDAP